VEKERICAELENLLDLTLDDGFIDMDVWTSFIKEALRAYDPKRYAERRFDRDV
jgi:hypothetical protein